jgi:hypothetical protein
MTANAERSLCVLYLSCIGSGIQYLLQNSDEFVRRFRVAPYFSHQMDRITDTVHITDEHFYGCDVFVYHNPDWITFSEEHLDAYEHVIAGVPSTALKIAVPVPQFHALWPFHTNDPRMISERALNRFGRPPDYPYGDSFVVELMRDGVPPEEIITRYLSLDVATRVDLDSLLSWSLSFMQRNDSGASFKVTDFIVDQFRSRRLFSTVNHASNQLLFYLANQILRSLDCATLPKCLLDRLQPLVRLEMPIHPSIGRHFGVAWLDEGTRHFVDDLRYLTFREYIRDYVYFE